MKGPKGRELPFWPSNIKRQPPKPRPPPVPQDPQPQNPLSDIVNQVLGTILRQLRN